VSPFFRRGLWVAALVSVSLRVFAEDAPLTPPMVQSSTEVPYPVGGHGEASVELELVIDGEGRVSSAVVTAGDEPFAERARSAALEWRFTPAMRGTKPVAARIRARVNFHEELESTPAPSNAGGAAASATASSTAQVESTLEPPPEVTVRGMRHEIGEATISTEDVREMPGAFGDSFRAIEALPGVTPVVSGLPFFYIRGAPPNDNAYFVDGVRVPLLFHVGVGEGVIHPSLIDHVDFYPGAAPAAFGRYAGAAISGETREPALVPHGEVNLRLIDAGALLESPFDEGRGSALVAGRYGYPGPILDAIAPTLRLGYWDYQARGTLRVGDHDAIGVFAFGSHDYLGTADTRNGVVGPITEQLGSDFHRVDLRYDHAWTDGHLRVAATLGYDVQGGAGNSDAAAVTTSTNESARLRFEMDQSLSTSVRFRGGADALLEHYGFSEAALALDPNGPPREQVPSSADPPPTNVTWGAYADVVWQMSPRVELVPGARFDVFDSTRTSAASGTSSTIVPAVDPRLSVRIEMAKDVAWLSSLGLSHQYPVLRLGGIPALIISVPGFPAGGSELQTAAQVSEGVEVRLPADFVLTTTGFFSHWSGLTDLTAGCIQIQPPTTPANGGAGPPPTPYTCPSDASLHGYAYGVELLLRRPLSKRLGGWLSYTLSRSTREEHFPTFSGTDAVATVASDYDRTHVLNAVLSYDLGRRWRAGGRFVFLSGTPYSNLSGNVPIPPYNAYRDPPFFRVDVRLEKRWPLGKDGFVAFVVEGQNVTLSKEVTPFGLSCQGTQTEQGGTTQCSHSKIGPLTIPSIGAEASF